MKTTGWSMGEKKATLMLRTERKSIRDIAQTFSIAKKQNLKCPEEKRYHW